MKLPPFLSVLLGFFFKEKRQKHDKAEYDEGDLNTPAAPLAVSESLRQPENTDSRIGAENNIGPSPSQPMVEVTIPEAVGKLSPVVSPQPPSPVQAGSSVIVSQEGQAQPTAAPAGSYSGFPGSYDGFPTYGGFPDDGGSYGGFPTYEGFPQHSSYAAYPTQTQSEQTNRIVAASFEEPKSETPKPAGGWADTSALTEDMSKGIVSMPANDDQNTDPLSIKDSRKS